MLELRFRLGRIVELARPHRVFATSPTFPRLVAGLRHAFAPSGEVDDDTLDEAERMRTALPMLLRKKLAELVVGTHLDAAGYRAACERAADRAGLLACGHVGVAIELRGRRRRGAPPGRSSRRASAISPRARSCVRGEPEPTKFAMLAA